MNGDFDFSFHATACLHDMNGVTKTTHSVSVHTIEQVHDTNCSQHTKIHAHLTPFLVHLWLKH